jgi:hypothetical protein
MHARIIIYMCAAESRPPGIRGNFFSVGQQQEEVAVSLRATTTTTTSHQLLALCLELEEEVAGTEGICQQSVNAWYRQ